MGDAMPGSNFDDVLYIGPEGRLSPRGPLKLGAGETLVEVYAWVTQRGLDGTGAFCSAEGGDELVELGAGKDGPSWTTEVSAEHKGQFLAGWARGTGVTIAKTDSDETPRVFWWEEDIMLEPTPPAAS